MSIVDVTPHKCSGKVRSHRGKYYGRKPAARTWEFYYILFISVAALILLLCSNLLFLSFNRHSTPGTHEVCPTPQVARDNFEVMGELEEIQQDSLAGSDSEIIDTELSPFHNILKRELWDYPVSDDEGYAPQRMHQLATLEESSLVIGETIVPYDHRGDLSQYVQTQLESSRIISKVESKGILAMIQVNSTDLIYLHAKTGMSGRLKNSLVLALCTQKGGNIHFMMVVLQVEAHLGWNRISSRERSAWNLAMTSSLERKMRKEADKILAVTSTDHANQPQSSDALRSEEGDGQHA
ncbi:hypothetical protein AXG93_402s1350 [Marchantia polymorpha subsp. ruderalis]|uniref:Uncharacterized protein n=1 Tax=Marchantia polymorpha subsp. ruderalis TaxID=1480154 RepID=A0A176WEE1_MARPO|nr:hypothetical protein AXG93_402s1350 [Marchantia polymorpha subsp. ruderalis]